MTVWILKKTEGLLKIHAVENTQHIYYKKKVQLLLHLSNCSHLKLTCAWSWFSALSPTAATQEEKRLREIAGISMEFVQVGITLYTNLKVNLLITNTHKIIVYCNVNKRGTPSIIIEPSPRYTFSTMYLLTPYKTISCKQRSTNWPHKTQFLVKDKYKLTPYNVPSCNRQIFIDPIKRVFL